MNTPVSLRAHAHVTEGCLGIHIADKIPVTFGIGTIPSGLVQRTAQKGIRKIRKQNSEAEADAIARLSSFCSKLSNDSPGTIAKVEVSRRNSNWARRFDSHGVVVR